MGIWPDEKTTGDPRQERGVGIRTGIKAGIKADRGAGTRIGIGMGIKVGTRVDTKWGNKRREDSRQGDKRDSTEVQSFTSRSYLLTERSFFFFTTSSSKSVTIWPKLSTTAGSAVNSKSVIFVKCGDPSSRYPVVEIWKPRTWRVLSAMLSVLKTPKSKASVSQSWLELKRHLLGSTLTRLF